MSQRRPPQAPALVALLAEGVDRNSWWEAMAPAKHTVALLAEGVDRNFVAVESVQN